jgi:mRNA-degrading endonuclease YafQ of YafQ-DinJ toxin-antitoxin module
VRRLLLRSRAFVRAAQRLVKKDRHKAKALQGASELLTEDAFSPRLKIHKLKGELEGSWACSASYNLRIVFDFLQHEEAEAILLQTPLELMTKYTETGDAEARCGGEFIR